MERGCLHVTHLRLVCDSLRGEAGKIMLSRQGGCHLVHAHHVEVPAHPVAEPAEMGKKHRAAHRVVSVHSKPGGSPCMESRPHLLAGNHPYVGREISVHRVPKSN